MRIERVETLTETELRGTDFSFDVDEEAVAPFDGPALTRVVPVTRYTKHYSWDDERIDAANPDTSMVAVVRGEDSRVAGYIVASRAWNHCAQIEDVAIDRAHRRRGLARTLMDEAVRWAKEQGLRMVRLETQSNNVPACRFYERYGFQLGGFDRYLYTALPTQTRPETALFWYLSVDL
ncbi:streptothricin acetyltransferase [Myxococcus stipitatus DSM 14675]|uniref:Streptothricin acetyltransferase n=2 Tax=Myxococcus stipitatus TaxID=83455 RepID=L7ULS9_MYXSD|nr:streptothricin acetyltransferase [Myxococcus stipitatus DSM 14675]